WTKERRRGGKTDDDRGCVHRRPRKCKAVVASRCDRNHWLTETAGQDRGGHGVRVRAIAQLAIVASAPSPYCAVGLERQVMKITARNGHDAAQTADLNGRSHP